MVLAKLLTNDNEIIRYSYQPEINGEYGILSYNIQADQMSIEQMAENDFVEWDARSHELAELRLVKGGMSQSQAHTIATQQYNYDDAIERGM